MSRKPLIAGNWKMNGVLIDACNLAAGIAAACRGVSDRDVLLAPPFTVISEVAHTIGDAPIILAGQNVCWEGKGAFTGEISPVMLRDAGATATLVGHSERRQIFGETDELINRRLKGALDFGLLTILCIGETLYQREKSQTFAVLEEQIRKGLADIAADRMGRVVIAYEPVWAIGTGKTASNDQAQEAHAFIRTLLADLFEKDIAAQTRILYGGSVKPTTIDELMAQPDIDGALVGGAALDVDTFGRIIHFTSS
jgi:triosephosphate isomerase